MAKGRGKQGPEDLNEVGFRMVDSIIRRHDEEPEPDSLTAKRAESGRKGGLKGGKTRAARLSPERRSEIARIAAAKRWDSTPNP